MTACECEVTQRGGAYAGYGIITILYAGALLQGIYDIPAIKYDGYRVYANLPPCGAMRGHGVGRHCATPSNVWSTAWRASSGSTPSRCAAPICCTRRPAPLNDLTVNSYGLAECLDTRRAGERLARAHRQAAARQGPRHGLLALCQRRGQADPLDRRAARGGQPQARLRRRRHRAHRRRRHRPGLLDHGGDRGGRDARHLARPHPRRRRRQRGDAQGQRRLFVAHHFHGRQRRDRRRQEAQGACWSRRRRASSRRARKTSNAPARRSASATAINRALPFADVVARGAGRRGRDHRRRERSPARPKRRAASTAAAPSARPWASATPRRWSRSASTRPPAWSASTRSGSRSTAATPSIRWRSKARSRARCGWAWARRCARRRATSKACRRMRACSNTACRPCAESPPIEVHIVESHDPDRAVRRQGGERRRAGRLPAGAGQRHRQRHRHRPQRIAGDAGPRDGGAGRAPAPGAARQRHARPRHDRLAPISVSPAARASKTRSRPAAENPDSRYIAGGTDLLVNMRRGIRRPGRAGRPFRHRRADRDRDRRPPA